MKRVLNNILYWIHLPFARLTVFFRGKHKVHYKLDDFTQDEVDNILDSINNSTLSKRRDYNLIKKDNGVIVLNEIPLYVDDIAFRAEI